MSIPTRSETVSLETLETEVQLQELIDATVEQNMVVPQYLHQFATYSDWQIRALKADGLRPEDKLLDVGCGALRLGVQAIPYLNDGHYYGVDATLGYLEAGEKILDAFGVDKEYTLLHSAEFEFDEFGVDFDYAVAQSVLTHLSQAQMKDCIESLADVMKSGGRFLFTYIERDVTRGRLYAGTTPMIHGAVDQSRLDQLATAQGARFEALDMDHPSQNVGLMEF